MKDMPGRTVIGMATDVSSFLPSEIFPSLAEAPACDGKPKGCGCRKGSLPGRGESGCAFRGAKRALQPIADTAHLVHGLASCETGSWVSRPTESSGPVLHRYSFSTALTEMDVVHGGERRLLQAIGELIETYDPPALFVYQTCLPAMIGDDIKGVCLLASQRWERPVIPVEAHGFAGSRMYGVHIAEQVLIGNVIGTPPLKTAHADMPSIVLVGENNLANEIGQIRPLLSALGIRIQASIPGDGRFVDIAGAGRTAATLAICHQGMGNLADMMQDELGIPCIRGSFYGPQAIAETLRSLTRLLTGLGAPDNLMDKAETLIDEQEKRIAPHLSDFRARLTGKRALLLCGGVKAWSLALLLKEAGMTIVGTSLGGASDVEMRHIEEKTGGSIPLIDGWESEDLDQQLRRGEIDIVLGGGNSQFLTLKARVPWLEVNHERTIPLTGYGGSLALLGAIDRTLSNPMWELIKKEEPWSHHHKAKVLPFKSK